MPTPTPAASTVITPGEEIASTCAAVVDEFFLSMIAELTGELLAEFSCPSEPARVAQGEWMSFAQGMMVAIEGTPLIYVYYASNGAWEQVPSGDAIALPEESEEVAPPPAPFAQAWLSEGRNVLLGEATQAEPLRSETIVQPFGGGILLGRRSDGQILLLARSKLRF